jgi:hypothetical protein
VYISSYGTEPPTRGIPERLPVLLLHLGRTGITLDGKELAVHFRGDRGDLGDHVLDALWGCQGGLRCRPIETMRLRVVLLAHHMLRI